MNSSYQLFKILHRAQIGIDSMIIVDGIGRACTALGDVGVRAYAFRSMLQDSSQPDVGDAQVFNRVESGFVYIVEGAAAVFSLAAIKVEVGLLVTEQAWKKLINVHTAKV